MTEAEWLACGEPAPMLDAIPADAGVRKLRLFAVACCRRVRMGNTSLTVSMAITAAEQLADGTGSVDEFLRLVSAAQRITQPGTWAYSEPAARITRAVRMLAWDGDDAYLDQIRGVVCEACADEQTRSAGADALRDVFGNPFRPVTFAPEWRTDIAQALAAQMYESRDFSALPILADALQDAGCDNEDILAHCRDPQQVHVRGCWVADLVLDKT